MNIRLRNTCFYACLLLILMFQGTLLFSQNFDSPVYLDVVEGQTLAYSYAHQGTPSRNIIFSQTGNFGTASDPLSQGGGNYVVHYTDDSSGNYGQDVVTLYLRKPGAGFVYRKLFINVIPSKVIAKDDFVTTGISQSVSIPVSSNDYGNRGVLNVTDISMENNGTATISNNVVSFVPKSGFEGIANLNYVVCDDVGTCDKATVHICVGDPHSYSNDTMSIITIKNNAVPIFSSLVNYSLIIGPSNGSLVTSNGILSYEPNANWVGQEDIVYQNPSTGFYKTISVDVMNVDAPNTYVKDDLEYAFVSQPSEINLLENDLFGPALYNVQIVTNPQNGTLTYIAKGYYLYIPFPGFEGIDEFTYSSSPNANGSNAETGTVNVIVNNREPALPLFELQTPKNTPLVIDYNIPISNFDFVITSNGSNGTVNYYPGYTDTLINGYEVQGNNLLIYYPNNNSLGVDSFEVEYCITGGSANCPTAKVLVDVQDIAGNLHCVGSDCVWPGDGNLDGTVDLRDLLPTGWCIGDVGTHRSNAVINPWHGQGSSNWGITFPHTDIDLKHLDANGDSIVNVADTLAINQHYQKYHGISPKPINFPSNIPLFLGAPDTIHVSGIGDTVRMPIILGDPNLPALDMYGLTFSIDFDPTVINPVGSSIKFDNESWVNYTSPALHMVKKPFEGRIDAGYTRTSGIPSNGYGRIGTVDFVIIDDVDFHKLPEFIYVRISGSVMNGAGDSQGESESFLRIRLGGKNVKPRTGEGNNLRPDPNTVMLFPHPAYDFINYRMVEGAKIVDDIEVYDLSGKKMLQRSHADLNGQIYTGSFTPGFYVIRIKTETGIVTKKFEVIGSK